MAYIRQDWVNGETIATAERMNHIESGIEEIDNSTSSIGNIYEQSFSDVNVPKGETQTNTTVATINLSAGIYVIVGHFTSPVYDYRCVLSMNDNTVSVYDNNGYVNGTITNIINIQDGGYVNLVIGYGSKDTTASGYIRAVKIK